MRRKNPLGMPHLHTRTGSLSICILTELLNAYRIILIKQQNRHPLPNPYLPPSGPDFFLFFSEKLRRSQKSGVKRSLPT